MRSPHSRATFISLLLLLASAAAFPAVTQENQQQPAATADQTPSAPAKNQNPGSQNKGAPSKPPSPADELQEAIANAGSDRAALLRNLQAYLVKYPESQQRPQIYRALVEAAVQLRDFPRAADYAERIVALTPDDMSITLVAIQLLQRSGDEAALRRAVDYAGRVLDFVDRTAMDEKSPKMSPEEWKEAKARDHGSVHMLRGQLYLKLKDNAAAQKDFAASYAEFPSAGAAEKLGEVAELNKDLPGAIQQYAQAFALADGANNSITRREIRQKIGNVWRLAHGSEDGLGEYLLHSYDQVAKATAKAPANRNSEAKEISQFMLRKAPNGAPFPMANTKGQVLVVSFWATWCGPCRALEPQFERVAAQFKTESGISFLEANCDDDETQVPPYLEEIKPHVPVVFADGLDHLLAVTSLPTVVIIDRAGKVAFRAEGFGDDAFERDLTAAARRALAAGNKTGNISEVAPATISRAGSGVTSQPRETSAP